MFVGDSLQRAQWQSFVCLVESIIPKKQKSMRRGRAHSVFKVKVLNWEQIISVMVTPCHLRTCIHASPGVGLLVNE